MTETQLGIDCGCGATITFGDGADPGDIIGNTYECPECGENVAVTGDGR